MTDKLVTIQHVDPHVPVSETAVIAVLMAAAKAGFDPRGERDNLTLAEMVRACAIIVEFLNRAGALRERSFKDWREAIEGLTFTLGSDRG